MINRKILMDDNKGKRSKGIKSYGEDGKIAEGNKEQGEDRRRDRGGF